MVAKITQLYREKKLEFEDKKPKLKTYWLYNLRMCNLSNISCSEKLKDNHTHLTELLQGSRCESFFESIKH